FKNNVVKGNGIVTTVVAMVEDKSSKSNNPKHKYKVLKVLLDSGSDGDLLFVQKGTSSIIPFKKRISPQKWRTSNGTFMTRSVGDLDLKFPEFSKSKTASFQPDIVEVPKTAAAPIYDLILGIKSLANIGAILDFAKSTVTIDQVELPMRAKGHYDMKSIRAQCRDLLEPISMHKATNRALEILDAKYENADLPKIITENCKHLSVRQQEQLLKLLLEFEELFDGTLGDWKAKPV
ncbi:MAG: hypothetical protein GY874_11815, partial [Desulfobacteraceae bacterium]|nr:hypothetical protein [Desulfobacteraceae bacterium]